MKDVLTLMQRMIITGSSGYLIGSCIWHDPNVRLVGLVVGLIGLEAAKLKVKHE